MQQLKTLLVLALIFLILDIIYIKLFVTRVYLQQFPGLMRTQADQLQPDLMAAVIVYAVLLAGLFIFVLPLAGSSVWRAFYLGGLFGAVPYVTYSFTNLAVFKSWSWYVASLDALWGMLLSAVACALAVALVAN